jgi:hypothetical protein
MTDTKQTFQPPYLVDTESPTVLTEAELRSGKSLIVASYDMVLKDTVHFHFSVDGKILYYKEARPTPIGVERKEVGKSFDYASDWELMGKHVVVHYTVVRDGAPFGQSAEFRFSAGGTPQEQASRNSPANR